MIRISTLFVISLFFTVVSFGQRVYVDNGTNTSYTLRTGDSLRITSGVFSGTVNSWEQGVKISVAEGAEFAPSSFGYYQGTLTVNGKATLPGIDGQSNKFLLLNYGRTIVRGYTYFGNNAQVRNSFGATLEFASGLNANNIVFENTGIVKVTGNWYMGNNSDFSNNNIIEVTGSLEFNGSKINNSGKLQSGGALVLSNGSFENNCRLVAENGLQINGAHVRNNGLIWVKASGSNPKLVNGGTIDGVAGSMVKSVDFENNGTVTGNGYYYFTGVTTHNSGNIGVNGSSDRIYVYDVTRSNPNTIFDNQWGSVRNNVSFLQFAAPDTIAPYPSCGLAYRSEVILPVKWKYFYVNLSNQVPALSWSAEQDNGTLFEVERSYDGREFSVISSFIAGNNETTFQYNDNQVNTQAAIVYYRVRATEPTGAQKITETRSVRFSGQQGLKVQTSPNPFTSHFSINFQASRRETISVRVYNMAGQQQFSRNITVASGFNSISIAEAASLNRGMYLVQLVNETGVIASEKIVKQ